MRQVRFSGPSPVTVMVRSRGWISLAAEAGAARAVAPAAVSAQVSRAAAVRRTGELLVVRTDGVAPEPVNCHTSWTSAQRPRGRRGYAGDTVPPRGSVRVPGT